MKLYKLVGTLAYADDAGNETITKWVGSQAEAGSTRADFISSGKVRKRADIVTESVEVPTDKKNLIDWLNTNVK